MKRLELEILYWASRAVLLFILSAYISDVGLYQEYAQNLLVRGQWPYRNFDFEYPPLAYPLMLLPGWITKLLGLSGSAAYRMVFGLLLIPFDRFLFRSFLLRPPFPRAAFSYVLLSSGMGLLLFDRFDLTVGFALAFPFLAGREPGWLRLALSFGLGGALKLVPISLGPLPALQWKGWKTSATWAAFLKYSLILALPIALSCGLAAWLGNGKISFLSHHTGRGVQVESLMGSLVIAAQAFFGWANASIVTNFGGQHLGAGPGVVVASRVLFYGALLFTYGVLLFERRRYSLLSGGWLVISGFVTFGYVLSPQFMLWLIPMGILVAGDLKDGRKRAVWMTLFSVVVVLTGAHFRYYWDYINMNHLSVTVVAGRNLCLVGLWIASWVWLKRPEIT